MGALLASIGLPLVIELGSKLCGKGLSVPKKAGRGLTVSPKPGMMLYQPPPFIGSWNNPVGMGGNKNSKKRTRTITWTKQPIQLNSNLRKHLVKPKFIDKPLSNFELLEWIDYLRVLNFKGIFSRDSKDHLHKTGSCIINLDDKIGPGTHWVATYIKPKVI